MQLKTNCFQNGIVKTYIDSLRILKLYDDRKLDTNGLKAKSKFVFNYDQVVVNIRELRQNLIGQNLASKFFGIEICY